MADLDHVLDAAPPAALTDYYTLREGKYHLNVKGDSPKLAEFRQKNIDLMKENDALTTKFAGIDPASIATERAELAQLRKGTPRLTELEAENARLKAATAEAETKANRIKLRAALTTAASAKGVRAEALDMAVNELEADFVMEGDTVKAKAGLFSPDRPGEARTPDEALTILSKNKGFLFKTSSGSGAFGNTGHASGTNPNVPVLRNPSPQELGRHASAIAAGKMRVVHDD